MCVDVDGAISHCDANCLSWSKFTMCSSHDQIVRHVGRAPIAQPQVRQRRQCQLVSADFISTCQRTVHWRNFAENNLTINALLACWQHSLDVIGSTVHSITERQFQRCRRQRQAAFSTPCAIRIDARHVIRIIFDLPDAFDDANIRIGRRAGWRPIHSSDAALRSVGSQQLNLSHATIRQAPLVVCALAQLACGPQQ